VLALTGLGLAVCGDDLLNSGEIFHHFGRILHGSIRHGLDAGLQTGLCIRIGVDR